MQPVAYLSSYTLAAEMKLAPSRTQTRDWINGNAIRGPFLVLEGIPAFHDETA
jgi:hypothetical protein